MSQLAKGAPGVERRRVGIAGMRAPARGGARILDPESGDAIGEITSGTFSPSLKKPVAMGYVARSHAKAGSPVLVEVRKKTYEANVSKMPFVEASYYRGD